MIVEQTGRTLDSDTGEIVDDCFMNLEGIEAELFSSLALETDIRIQQVKLLIAVHDRGLYRQGINDDGENFTSFQSWLKSIEPRLSAIGAGRFRSLLDGMIKYKIYIQQLGYPESFLRQLGAHLTVLLPAAARHIPTSQLLPDDEPLENGKRLGKDNFKGLTDEIAEHVLKQDLRVPETQWQVHDTKERVDELLGRENVKVHAEVSAKWAGSKIKIDRVVWWIGDFMYSESDLWEHDHFVKAFKGATVNGLGEDWKG